MQGTATISLGGCKLVQEKIGSQGWGFWGEGGRRLSLEKAWTAGEALPGAGELGVRSFPLGAVFCGA